MSWAHYLRHPSPVAEAGQKKSPPSLPTKKKQLGSSALNFPGYKPYHCLHVRGCQLRRSLGSMILMPCIVVTVLKYFDYGIYRTESSLFEKWSTAEMLHSIVLCVPRKSLVVYNKYQYLTLHRSMYMYRFHKTPCLYSTYKWFFVISVSVRICIDSYFVCVYIWEMCKRTDTWRIPASGSFSVIQKKLLLVYVTC